MAKSKTFKEFRLEDGRVVAFNQEEFKFVINEKAKSIEQRDRIKRGGKERLFRMIAGKLVGGSNEDYIKSTMEKVKNWYYGNNGPAELQDIYMLADILECENKEIFLEEKKKHKEEKMKVSSAEMVNVNFDHGKIIRAMWSLKEKEAAYELYSAFVDLMGSYLKADMDVWVEYDEGTSEWETALANFPRRMPVECAIQKAKMYLSEDTIHRAYNLLETMYGPTVYEGEEPCNLRYDINYLMSGFRSERLDLYDEYLRNKEIKKEFDGNHYRDEDWYWFMMELNGEWWRMLEEVFEEYIP